MAILETVPFEFGKEWLKKLLGKLVETRQKRRNELDSIANVFGDPEALARNYIEPDCQQFNPADFDHELATVVREPIFSRMRSFITHASPTRTKSLLILSDAGMGKTSALVMLKLTHLLSFWPSGYDCKLLKLGPDAITALSEIQNKRSTVLLLDALDEDPTAWGRVGPRLTEIFFHTSAFRATIITCRTQFFSAANDPFNRRGHAVVGGYSAAVIYNSLFSDSQVLAYVKRRAHEQPNPAEWQARALTIVKRIGYLRMRPMLLAHLDDILESRNEIWDEYSLYEALIHSWLLREQRKKLERSDEYPSEMAMLRACQLLALKMQADGRISITHNEIQIHSAIYSKIEPILSQHLGGRSLLNRNSDGDFRFSHYSIQEFLVVSYYLEAGPKKTHSSVRSTDQMNRLALSWLKRATPAQLEKSNLSIFSFDGADFSGKSLTGANFSGSSLRGAIFAGSQLIRCRFSSAALPGSDFSKCHLLECELQDSNLAETRFVDSIIHECNFSRASFQKTMLRTAKITASIFTGAYFDASTAWPHEFDPLTFGALAVPARRSDA